MASSTRESTFIVYSQSPNERDFLRTTLMEEGFTSFSFEMETICFDNLASIRPTCIIAKTDSASTVWRFIFALNRFWQNCTLILVSDTLNQQQFRIEQPKVSVHCFPKKVFSNGMKGAVRKWLFIKPKRFISEMPLIVGQTETIRNIRNMLPCLESSRNPILITGEKGTGKELLARAIGLWSMSDSLFIKVDCSQLHPRMIADNMVNREKFLGDRSKKRTILLDKIHLLKPSVQAELLLLIENANDLATSGKTAANSLLRLIATSESNIEHMVRQDRFRKDLYYRLKVMPISMPALRHRREDISLFVDYFLIEACAKLKKSVIIPSEQTREQLFLYDWPGNLSELKKTMHRIALTGDEASAFANERILNHKKRIQKRLPYSIEMEALPSSFEILNYLPVVDNLSLRRICNEFVSRTEKKLMKKALMTTSWNRKKAAGLLNISYKSLLNKIKTYEIT
jgi:two-component system response regulator AtoC